MTEFSTHAGMFHLHGMLSIKATEWPLQSPLRIPTSTPQQQFRKQLIGKK